MSTGEIEVVATAAAPSRFSVPMQNIPGRIATWADHPLNHVLTSIATATRRDQPRPQQHLRRRSAKLDHDLRRRPGKPRQERAGSSGDCETDFRRAEGAAGLPGRAVRLQSPRSAYGSCRAERRHLYCRIRAGTDSGPVPALPSRPEPGIHNLTLR